MFGNRGGGVCHERIARGDMWVTHRWSGIKGPDVASGVFLDDDGKRLLDFCAKVFELPKTQEFFQCASDQIICYYVFLAVRTVGNEYCRSIPDRLSSDQISTGDN